MRAPDEAQTARAVAACEAPFANPPGDIEAIREALYDCMWNDVGIVRNGGGLRRALAKLDSLDGELDRTGVLAGDRTFDLTWHDWLNLKSLIGVGRAIATAALARENSRGAHYRDDFPAPGDVAASTYTLVRARERGIDVSHEPVHFTRVRPGQSLLR
jgi:fumarate reductase flavoprotein subunit